MVVPNDIWCFFECWHEIVRSDINSKASSLVFAAFGLFGAPGNGLSLARKLYNIRTYGGRSRKMQKSGTK